MPKSYKWSLSFSFPLSKFQTLCNFCNVLIFKGEENLNPRPTPKLEDHPVSAVRECLFSAFTATLRV